MCVCDPLTVDGYHYVEWIGQYFGSCVYKPIDIVAFFIGLTNIGFWLFAQIPQLVENYRLKRVEALHPLFLTQWLLGDLTNLIGCIFTRQTPVQTYTAIYFCSMDVVLLAQWFYYAVIRQKAGQKKDLEESKEPLLPSEENSNQNTPRLFAVLFVMFAVISLSYYGNLADGISPNNSGRVLLDYSTHRNVCNKHVSLTRWEKMIGYVAAWISGVLYFCARMPQIYLNFKRKSVEGLAFGMFFCSVMANACYGLSILLPGVIINAEFWRATFPYLLGSICVLSESSVIVFQFMIYKWIPDYKKRRLHQKARLN